jgi:hypothetical protein
MGNGDRKKGCHEGVFCPVQQPSGQAVVLREGNPVPVVPRVQGRLQVRQSASLKLVQYPSFDTERVVGPVFFYEETSDLGYEFVDLGVLYAPVDDLRPLV